MITDQFEHLLDRFDDIISGKTRDMLTDIDVAECYSLSKKIIDQKSDDCLGWNCLAHIELLDKRFTDARMHYKRSLDINPFQEAGVKLYYTVALIESGDMKEALVVLQALNRQEIDNDIDLYMELMFISYFELGYLGRALVAFNQITDPSTKTKYQKFVDDILKRMPFFGNGGVYTINKVYQTIKYYPLFIPINHEPLPDVFTNEFGKNYYIDRIGGKARPISREEQVRQRVLSYLVSKLDISPSWILVEENLAHVDRDLNKRVDILVRIQVKGKYKNLMLIECKEPNTAIEGGPIIQALEYNEVLACPYILVTNGEKSYFYFRNKETGQYLPLIEPPNANDMLAEKGIVTSDIDFVEWQRPSWETLRELPFIENMKKSYSFIGPLTDINDAPVMLNIGYGLLDVSTCLKKNSNFGHIQLIDDLGICDRKVGNPSGGSFDGSYRWIKIRDRLGREQYLYLSVFVTLDFESESGKTSGGYTSLVIAIDHKNKPLSVFELNLNKYLHSKRVEKSGAVLYQINHSGIRNRGTVSELISFIQENEPTLVEHGRIFLGNLDDCENFTMSNPQFSEFVLRVIAYSLLRYELRTSNTKKRKGNDQK